MSCIGSLVSVLPKKMLKAMVLQRALCLRFGLSSLESLLSKGFHRGRGLNDDLTVNGLWVAIYHSEAFYHFLLRSTSTGKLMLPSSLA